MPLTPMMNQYLKVKDENKDSIVFYRLGDFYEMFFEDAVTASRELEITLTGRDCGLNERAPMCGVPYHAAENYIAKLISKGYSVAICEQTTEPEAGKGLVEREVVRVITPGTLIGSAMLDETKNNYVMSVYREAGNIGIAWADVSTGEFNMDECGGDIALGWLNEKLTAITPAETICNKDIFKLSNELSLIRLEVIAPFKLYDDSYFDKSNGRELFKSQFKTAADDKIFAMTAAGALLNFIRARGKREFSYISEVKKTIKFMSIDYSTRKNLELTETMKDHKTKKGSVFALINKTSTSMGARLLRNWLLQPLNDSEEINLRFSAVEELSKNTLLRESLAEQLKSIHDIARLCGKISFGNANPVDCVALGSSISKIPAVKKLLDNTKSPMLNMLNQNIKNFEYFGNLINNFFVDNPSTLISGGGFVREGYNAEIDDLKNISNIGKKWLMELEAKEKEETGIKNLKIGFNKVFGYYLEVTKSQIENVPYRYVRKQTTANSERYITEELKHLEQKILGAESESVILEQRLFVEVIKQLKENAVNELLIAAESLAALDAVLSLAIVAVINGYKKPIINESINHIEITDGRHAVVESLLSEEFVPNDTLLDRDKNKIMIITGPNMAGKSTYMRQVAIIILLAHIGSFVPARKAVIPIVDRIFTRVGASDDLAFGQSTFMVEMSEVANILHNATENSFLVFDEIGRGTSTLDGLSIAWSVVEYLAKKLNAMALFSTHYHELTELEGIVEGVKNYRISIRELNNTIIFLRKIVRGGSNRSFGIEVAQMAGLPESVILRAKELLKKLESADITKRSAAPENASVQLSLFASNGANEIINILKDINIETMSPLKAFDILSNLLEKADKL